LCKFDKFTKEVVPNEDGERELHDELGPDVKEGRSEVRNGEVKDKVVHSTHLFLTEINSKDHNQVPQEGQDEN